MTSTSTLQAILCMTMISIVSSTRSIELDGSDIVVKSMIRRDRLSDKLIDGMRMDDVVVSTGVKKVGNQQESGQGNRGKDCSENCAECFDYTDCTACDKGYHLTSAACIADDDVNDQSDLQIKGSGKVVSWLLWIAVVSVCFCGCLFGLGKLRQRRQAQDYQRQIEHERKIFEMTSNEQARSPRHHDFEVPKIKISPPKEETRTNQPTANIYESELHGMGSLPHSTVIKSKPGTTISQEESILVGGSRVQDPAFDSFLPGVYKPLFNESNSNMKSEDGPASKSQRVANPSDSSKITQRDQLAESKGPKPLVSTIQSSNDKERRGNPGHFNFEGSEGKPEKSEPVTSQFFASQLNTGKQN